MIDLRQISACSLTRNTIFDPSFEIFCKDLPVGHAINQVFLEFKNFENLVKLGARYRPYQYLVLCSKVHVLYLMMLKTMMSMSEVVTCPHIKWLHACPCGGDIMSMSEVVTCPHMKWLHACPCLRWFDVHV